MKTIKQLKNDMIEYYEHAEFMAICNAKGYGHGGNVSAERFRQKCVDCAELMMKLFDDDQLLKRYREGPW